MTQETVVHKLARPTKDGRWKTKCGYYTEEEGKVTKVYGDVTCRRCRR